MLYNTVTYNCLLVSLISSCSSTSSSSLVHLIVNLHRFYWTHLSRESMRVTLEWIISSDASINSPYHQKPLLLLARLKELCPLVSEKLFVIDSLTVDKFFP